MTVLTDNMTFGIFMAPFHRVGENPTLALERDLELIEWLDVLGFDEAWIGEHHSAGWEIDRLARSLHCHRRRAHRHIRLGTGVDQPALSPPTNGGQPYGAPGPPDPWSGHPGRWPRGPGFRCRHARY